MNIEELAELDRQYREHLRQASIRDVRRGIAIRAAQSGRLDNLQRHLDELLAESESV